MDDRQDVKRWEFDATPRISTYVTALVAGPYHVVRDEFAGKEATVPLGLFCRASLAEHLDAEELFDVTRRGFGFFEDVFGLAYPFAKFDQLFVPEFNSGAMENVGAVTHHEDYVFRSRVTDAAHERRAETILHEMAHMWFGDLVTMRWWDDLWLNESFATWASVLSQSESTRWTGSRHGPPSPCPRSCGHTSGPAFLHPSDLGRHPRPRRRPGQLRRHHLREGSQRPQAARGLGRTRRVPGRCPGLLRRARVGHRALRPVRPPGEDQRP